MRGDRGYSVLELTIAAGLFSIVLAGVMLLYAAQNRLAWIAQGQYDVQTAANAVLDDLVEGEKRTWAGAATVRGLRCASDVVVNNEDGNGICFRTRWDDERDHVVTYYREGSTLYRRVVVTATGEGNLELNTADGVPVLRT